MPMPLMVPFPVPALVTVRIAVLGDVGLELKVAIQVILVESIITTILARSTVKGTEQSIPDQPAKTELASGIGVKITLLPWG